MVKAMKSVAKHSPASKAMKVSKITPEKAKAKAKPAKTSSSPLPGKVTPVRPKIKILLDSRRYQSSPSLSSCSTLPSEEDKKAALIAKVMSLRQAKEGELTAKTEEVRTLKRKATEEANQENDNPNQENDLDGDGNDEGEDDAPQPEGEQKGAAATETKDGPGTSKLAKIKVEGKAGTLSTSNVGKIGGMSLTQKMEKMQAAFAAGEGIQSERKESSVINGFLKQFENEMFLGNCFKCFCCIWNVTVFPLSPGCFHFWLHFVMELVPLKANWLQTFFTLKETLNNWLSRWI